MKVNIDRHTLEITELENRIAGQQKQIDKRMSTYLKIRCERTEDDLYEEEIWERENDGVLFSLFMAITALIHAACKIREGKDEIRKEER